MQILKNKIKSFKVFNPLFLVVKVAKGRFVFNPFLFLKDLFWFYRQCLLYKKSRKNKNFEHFEHYPCLTDNTEVTPIDPVYFYQDTWAAKKIFELNPSHHLDVGSSVKTLAILSQHIPVTIIDIRPIEVKLDNLNFIEGSILKLPLEDNSIATLSSLCVVEHIGLGRYGDQIDPFGSEKAVCELKRVLKKGGVIIFSVPVDTENKVYFNAHRAFTRDYILDMFNGFELLEEKYQYGNSLYNSYDKLKGFGTGLYMFKKTI